MSRKKSNTKQQAQANAAREQEFERKKLRVEWWKMAVGAAVLLIAALIKVAFDNSTPEDPPRFALRKPVTRPDSGLHLLCLNSAARKKQPLFAELDGVRLPKPVQPTKFDEETWQWHFALDPDFFTPQNLADGAHKVVVGFDGNFSDTLAVIFNTRIPHVAAEIAPVAGKPGQRALKVQAAGPVQIAAETLAVDIVFNIGGAPVHLPLPARRVTDQQSGVTYFEFEARISDLPEIAPDDPRYSEDFFAFRVQDQAGNFYYDVKSYAQFIAPGRNRFGAGNIADIEMMRLPEDLQKNQRLAFRFHPKPLAQPRPLDGERRLTLVATLIGDHIERLGWTELPPELRSDETVTLVYKNQEEPVITFGVNTYGLSIITGVLIIS